VKLTHKVANIAEIYMREISKLHDVPKAIVFDRDHKFTSNFCKGSFKGFRKNMNFITTYHLESYEKTKRVNQVFENMLRMYVMDKKLKWEYYLHLVEFVYNNVYHAFEYESIRSIIW
jgi:hypothetical protein